MADEPQTVREVSWSEVFGFTHIFKSFKLAIHPGKIMLALAAIVLTLGLGYVMQWIWSGVDKESTVMRGEAWALWTTAGRPSFVQEKGRWLQEDRVGALAGLLRDAPTRVKPGDAEDRVSTQPAADAKDKFAGMVSRLRKRYEAVYLAAAEKARQDFEKAREEAKDEKARAKVRMDRQPLVEYIARTRALDTIVGDRIFAGFLQWQRHCVSNALRAVRQGQFLTGLGDLCSQRGVVTGPYGGAPAGNIPRPVQNPNVKQFEYGLAAWLVMMAWGFWWMLSTYPLFSIIFLLLALAIWSLLGGAVCRIAALHATRGETVSMRSAVKFAASKFLSFLVAPVVPLAFIVGIGLVLALGGLIGAVVPYAGEWFAALLFPLALLGGGVIAFLAIGLAGGAPLMWPTIAVEGSDSFDALGRSYHYLLTRPFRYGLYWLVAAVYGTVCYLFVRLFAFVALRATHCWVGWAMRLAKREMLADGAGKLDAMWAQPTFESFHGPWQFEAMKTGSEKAAAVVVGVWVLLVAGVVTAFLFSFLFSAATNIYLLLRRKMDATDLDDVYIEEEMPPAEGEAAPAEAPTEEKPAEEKPAEQPPAEQPPAEQPPAEQPPAGQGPDSADKPQ